MTTEVTAMFVNEETGDMTLLHGEGATFHDAIDLAILKGPERAPGLILGAILPGKLEEPDVAEWLETLLNVVNGA